MPVATDAPETRLDYAARPPWHRRRRLRFWLLAAIVLLLGAAAWRWQKPVLSHAKIIYWQHACLTYTAGADQVVYEEDPALASPLLSRAEYLALPSAGVYMNAPNPASMPPVAAFQPRCYRSWYQASFGVPPLPSAVLFLHELRTPMGVRRLVLVERDPQSVQPMFEPFELRASVFELATWTGAPARLPPPPKQMMVYDGPVAVLEPASLRFHAGQPDPADPAHFTIRYTMKFRQTNDGPMKYGSGTIDGRLTSDGAAVKFSVRDGPATWSAWGKPMFPDP